MTEQLTGQQIHQLLADINPNRVASRKAPGGGNKQMSYVEAYEIKAKLIAVFGFVNFTAGVVDTKILKIEEFEEPVFNWENNRKGSQKQNADGTPMTKTQYRVTAMVTYELRIHLTGAAYTESAVASQKGADLGEVADFAVKTAESDALKRCATYLGTQFGLSLYASDDNHVHYSDVVRTVLDPEQQKLLNDYRAQREAQRQSEALSGGQTTNDATEASNAAESATEAAAKGALAGGFRHPEARSK